MYKKVRQREDAAQSAFRLNIVPANIWASSDLDLSNTSLGLDGGRVRSSNSRDRLAGEGGEN